MSRFPLLRRLSAPLFDPASGSLCSALFLLFLLLLPALAVQAVAANRYPLVLVHGFTGWGQREMGGYRYWGGRDDLVGVLNGAGYETRAAAVGPLSSNWDRACELYAVIRGGRIDYGAVHAARHGHARYGRTLRGLYPDWGDPGDHERIHLLGHSQGGQTIRVLTALLQYGDADERAAGDHSPLFRGGQSWVHSVTSVATPHDGTTLAMVLHQQSGVLLNWLLGLAGSLGAGAAGTSYDFKLDQWGVGQRPGEADEDYRARLAASGLWAREDISLHDLHPAGAAALNRRFPAAPATYYFSWAARDMVPGPLGKGYLPAPGMNLALLPASLAISQFTSASPGPGLPVFDAEWWPNDGVVNTVSMSGPRLGSRDRIENVAGRDTFSPVPGIWQFMGVKDGWDHLDVVGQQTSLDYEAFYLDWAHRLASLPPAASVR